MGGGRTIVDRILGGARVLGLSKPSDARGYPVISRLSSGVRLVDASTIMRDAAERSEIVRIDLAAKQWLSVSHETGLAVTRAPVVRAPWQDCILECDSVGRMSRFAVACREVDAPQVADGYQAPPGAVGLLWLDALVMSNTVIPELPNDDVMLLPVSSVIPFDAGGAPILHGTPNVASFATHAIESDEFRPEHWGQRDNWYAMTAMNCAVMAIAMMHCKNAELLVERVPEAVRKAHRKRHGRDMVKRYVLDIEPAIQGLRRDSGHSDIKMAMHTCRGHFADYRKGKGLFGKLKGLYWINSHVRGSEEHGVVEKDYAVAAPKVKP